MFLLSIDLYLSEIHGFAYLLSLSLLQTVEYYSMLFTCLHFAFHKFSICWTNFVFVNYD